MPHESHPPSGTPEGAHASSGTSVQLLLYFASAGMQCGAAGPRPRVSSSLYRGGCGRVGEDDVMARGRAKRGG